MEIHRPKPVHGWREFLTEIGVIVVGVMIALTGEHFVDEFRWAERTRETKEHLRAELRLITADAGERLAFEPCERAMISVLEQALVKSGDEWKPPYVQTVSFGGASTETPVGPWKMTDPKGVLFAAPMRWDSQAWRNAQADGTANHLSQKDNAAFGRMYETVGRAKALGDQLFMDMSELNALAMPQRLDAASRAEYLRVIGRVRGALSNSVILNGEILQRAEKLNAGKPRLEESALMIQIQRAFCSQFSEGRTDIVYHVPKAKLENPIGLPPE